MKSRTQGALAGLAVGGLYFWHSEAGQEKESNCSYLAPWTTDLGAVVAAGIVYANAKSASSRANFWLGAVAGAITAIHIGQFMHYKLQLPKSTQNE